MSAVLNCEKEDQTNATAGDLGLVACPTSQDALEPQLVAEVGRYNPRFLAGQALSLADSLTPSYMQVYVNSLASYAGLKALNKKKK